MASIKDDPKIQLPCLLDPTSHLTAYLPVVEESGFEVLLLFKEEILDPAHSAGGGDNQIVLAVVDKEG